MTENQSVSDAQAVTPYDVIPYDGTYAITHPFRLETSAVLLGMDPPPVANCRVLELGAGTGTNLIHQAASLPGATFVGMDLSSHQVEEGRHVIQAAGLNNIELRHADILDVDDSWGQFDYIICHGVYSWVPASVRDKILEICKRHLASNGVALVSYNVFPGWHLKRMIRDVVLYHASQYTDPKQQIAGAKHVLKFMVDMHPEESIFGQVLRQTLGKGMNLLAPEKDFYLFHDLMEPVNEPCLFYEFAEAAAGKGLQYMWDANVLQATDFTLPAKIRQAVEKAPLVRKEQYKDFLLNRAFRSTLLCHVDVSLQRSIGTDKVRKRHIALARDFGSVDVNIRNDDMTSIPLPHGAVTVKHRLAKATIMHLKEIFPQFVSFENLKETATKRIAASGGRATGALDHAEDTVASMVLTGYASGLCELCVTPPHWCLTISERPRASALTLLNAREGKLIVNPLQVPIPLNVPSRYLLQHLTGEHDREGLVGILQDAVRAETLSVKATVPRDHDLSSVVAQFVDTALHRIARAGLLIE